ncbi:MAG: AAA family ATPase [Chromatiales bacterium]|nr:AAA family ATPase [Chromatiales bacterium]
MTRAGEPVEDQSAVIAFLVSPQTHGGITPVRIDTHGAVVALAGPDAYKLKRAVVFPFLDYGTLAKRRAALEAELAINRPLAPQVYREVVAVTRGPGGGLQFGGDGPVLDYVLHMARFDEQSTLDHIVARRPLSADEVDHLAGAIVAAHATAAPADADAWIADLGVYITQNDAALREFAGLGLPSAIDALTAAARRAFAAILPLLNARATAGYVRRCHGDLHLGNIVLLDGRPTLFDAIEFDPRIAAGDVLYDLAFLVMDLCQAGHRPAANRLLNRYLVEAREPAHVDGLAALPLFLHLRAAIRAKVTAARAGLLAAPARDAAFVEAGRYLHFATTVLAPPAPRLVAIGGLSGTGKTALAHALAPRFGAAPGALVIRSDVERKALFGVAETDRLPPGAYSAAASADVFARVADAARRALAAGRSVVCDAVYARPPQRRAIAAVAAAAGVPFTGLWLDLPLEVRLARIGNRHGDASDADASVARQQQAYDCGPMDWARIDASGTLPEVAARAAAILQLPD